MMGNTLVFGVALFTVLTRGTLDPGAIGLSLSYALNVSGYLQILTRNFSDIETNFVSAERIQEYQAIRQEAPYELPENNAPQNWPENGVVRFEDYQTRYRDGLDLVLKGVNVNIRSGEKVGIVGRTGAGKSSLTLALFRIIEAAEGSIIIDDMNIKHLGLGQLREGLTIIPQDPVLFSGTLRINLDPLNKYSDTAIWRALKYAHLESFVTNLPEGLEYHVLEGGENLSLGQRQLICLARALLRKTKILILDEATAAVDLETDDIVQKTIREEFADCTVITIAHRLNTVMDSSRILVMDGGVVAEYDSPKNLMADKFSVFYGMARDAGLVATDLG